MEFEKKDILAQLDKIISNKIFSRSKINVRLLKFLVKATLEEEDIKETTIGVAFFGAKYDPTKSDNKVRVYVYHLRKKLEEYYQTTASSNEITFHIAKGQYQVQFEKEKKEKTKNKPFNKWFYKAGLVFVLVSLGLLFYVKKDTNDFWKTIMQNNFPTTVVFGDYFTIEGVVKTGGFGVIRDYEINSEEELNDFLEKNPEKLGKMRPSQHHYFNWMAPYCSKLITAYWSKHNYPFEITQTSEWSILQLGRENVVYFGQSKAMGMLKDVLVENFPQYTFKNEVLERVDPKTNKRSVYKDVNIYDKKITDYTIVAKISMPAGNEMRLFLSDQDCGAISALEYFTNTNNVSTFYKEHGLNKNEDFIALFKVTGWLRKSYEMEFVLLDRKVRD